MLRSTLDWALKYADNYRFAHRFANLVSGVFSIQGSPSFAVLETWIEYEARAHFKLLGHVLRAAPTLLVFDEPAVVAHILKAARNHGKAVERDMSFALYVCAAHGMRSGRVGAPFPEDLALKDQAQKMLATISKAHPAFGLYDDLLKHAEGNIRPSMHEAKKWMKRTRWSSSVRQHRPWAELPVLRLSPQAIGRSVSHGPRLEYIQCNRRDC